MPIASSAESWTPSQPSQSNASSRSSMCSNGSKSPIIENGLRHQDSNGDDTNDEHIHSHSQDDFKDDDYKDPVPISKQPSHLSRQMSAYTVGDDSVEDLSWLRQKCGELVDSERLQIFILVLIAINSIMIGIATFPIVKENEQLSTIFEVIDLLVLIIFTIESIIQFIFNGYRRFFKDGWLVFDLIIVTISWVSVEIDALKAFRVFRALRFVTRVSVLRNVVVALFSIVPAITAIFTLLLLIFYIFAVMFTTLLKDLYKEGYTQVDYFGRMDYSLFTLFQIMCLDEWSGIAYEVGEKYFWAWAIFIAFVVMTAFVVVNLLIAVICDALQILRTAEEAMLEQKLYGQELVGGDDHNNDAIGEGGDYGENNTMSSEKMRQRIAEMQHMLDEMASSQETMSRTIQYLSLALYAERKTSELGSIRELKSEDTIKEAISEEKSPGVVTLNRIGGTF